MCLSTIQCMCFALFFRYITVLCHEIMSRVPLIVVLGATGTGKSKLAIELALKFNGEIISADSMQVYKKLDIITNKVTPEERNLVPHHIIDFLSPLKRYSVVEFRNHALKTIDEIVERKKIPIVVGGTNYYIEALLWKILVDADRNPQERRQSPSQDGDSPFPEALFAKLTHCKAILQYVQDALRAPISTLFECIEPVYRIQPQVPQEELQGFSNRVLNDMFGKTTAIENIKRHKNAIQVIIRIVEEIFEFIFNLQQLVSETEKTKPGKPRTYVKHVLLPNLCSTNTLLSCNFVSALFPEMSKLQAEVEEALREVERVLDGGVLGGEEAERAFRGRVEAAERRTLERLGGLVQELSSAVVIEEDCLNHLPVPELHQRLNDVDPVRAAALHPNDRRKVFRSLQVYLRTGKTHSGIIKEQRSEAGGSDLGGPLRFQNTCIFWIQANQTVLDTRLDKRVDEMIESGLIQEISDFHDEYNAKRLLNNEVADYTKGIFQSIGFKEFHNYLILDKEERKTAKGQRILQEGINALKMSTWRYSRSQIKWLKNRFFKSKDRQIPPIYNVDSSNVDEWNEKVLSPASEVVSHLLTDGVEGLSKCQIKPIPKETDHPHQDRHKNFYCEPCQRLFIGTLQWEAHLKSKKHAKFVAGKRKEAVP
ncbi:unnamed protein product [Bemisia tabaci]|uniref:C2H2-type domain-containing protein n=1 Tax=Bemisia tabaci TaxID=7038 RepID=A0A9P0AFZ7_BEMTA|nr:unnamed protein product [Bemisia tabaci]